MQLELIQTIPIKKAQKAKNCLPDRDTDQTAAEIPFPLAKIAAAQKGRGFAPAWRGRNPLKGTAVQTDPASLRTSRQERRDVFDGGISDGS